MQYRARKRETDQAKHGICQYSRRGGAANAIMQNEHDADQHDREYCEDAASDGAEPKAERDDQADKERDDDDDMDEEEKEVERPIDLDLLDA